MFNFNKCIYFGLINFKPFRAEQFILRRLNKGLPCFKDDFHTLKTKQVEQFNNLYSGLTDDGKCSKEIRRRKDVAKDFFRNKAKY